MAFESLLRLYARYYCLKKTLQKKQTEKETDLKDLHDQVNEAKIKYQQTFEDFEAYLDIVGSEGLEENNPLLDTLVRDIKQPDRIGTIIAQSGDKWKVEWFYAKTLERIGVSDHSLSELKIIDDGSINRS